MGAFQKSVTFVISPMATEIISNQQCDCLRPWYHRPGGASMMACGNIKEDHDCGTVES